MTASRSLPPGSFGLPLVGETPEFLIDADFVARRFKRYGPVFRSHLLGRPIVFFGGADAARFVLSSHMDYFSWAAGWPETFRILIGDALFTMDGDEHRRHRNMMAPAFHGAALRRYLATMEEITRTYLAKWLQQREIAWFPEFKQLTFAIAVQLLMGVSPGPDVARLSALFTDLTNGLFAMVPTRQRWTPFGRALAARHEIVAFVTSIVEQRRDNLTDDVISLLLAARDEDGNPLEQDEIVAQAILLLFGGHDTTTAMLTALCLELARHPDVLQRARAEQQALAIDGPLTIETLGRMPYLEQVLREVERLQPPLAGGFRGVVKPFEFNGYHVPAGWLASYSILKTHIDPEIYPDPKRFDPDRFAPGREEHKQKAFSLIGFGGGPRFCLGMAFALMEIKIIASHLLRRYQWELLPGQNLDMTLVPSRRPKDNLRVYFSYWHGV